MQKIPERLEDWTYGKIEDLVNNNVNESETHDFKSNIPDSIELTKDCCAFANTKGGFIILGVKEAGQRFRIAGIDNDKDLANKFGKKINALPTNPNFELAPFVDIPQSNKVLAVIHIARSRYRPHIPSQKELRIFWKRTNTGNEHMSYEEIRKLFREVFIKERSITMNEIKFRILFKLYQKQYSDQIDQPLTISDLITAADLVYFERNFVNWELVYLTDGNFIRQGRFLKGEFYFYTVTITYQGIDLVKKWIGELLEIMKEESRSDYDHIQAVATRRDKLLELWAKMNQNNNLRNKFFKNSAF